VYTGIVQWRYLRVYINKPCEPSDVISDWYGILTKRAKQNVILYNHYIPIMDDPRHFSRRRGGGEINLKNKWRALYTFNAYILKVNYVY